MTPHKLVIASRESALAMWQAEHIQSRLRALYPSCEVSILGLTTQGDRILDKTLSKIGGKGLFVKELEQALSDGRADLAVHSIKDVPMVLPEGFALAAICERESPFDAFVSNDYRRLEDLPAAGQGALGIEIAAHRSELLPLLAPLNHAQTAACVTAERALARALGGSCQVPLAAYCTEQDGLLTLHGLVGHPDSSVILREEAQAPREYADALGRAIAKKLADNGAQERITAVLAEQAT